MNFVAGCVAQLCGSLAWVPMDVIKERLQIEGQVSTVENFGGSWSAFRNIIRHEGVLGLYRAYWMHQLTWAPFNGLYFSLYEECKKYLVRHPITPTPEPTSSSGVDGVAKQSAVDKFICAVVAGSIASTATSPIDLVKTRLQVQRSNPAVFDYTGPLDATLKILKREGVMALYDGVGARMLWLTPRLSITVTIYEVCNDYVRKNLRACDLFIG